MELWRVSSWARHIGHYDSIIPATAAMERMKNTEERNKVKGKEEVDKKIEVYWCKDFQRDSCDKQAPHMVTI